VWLLQTKTVAIIGLGLQTSDLGFGEKLGLKFTQVGVLCQASGSYIKSDPLDLAPNPGPPGVGTWAFLFCSTLNPSPKSGPDPVLVALKELKGYLHETQILHKI
jgi:hypothetical protein